MHANRKQSTRISQAGSVVYGLVLVAVAALAVFIFKTAGGSALAKSYPIKSASGYCLDDYRSRNAPGATVDSWSCNKTAAQDWTVTATTITHGPNYCLSVESGGKQVGNKVVLDNCSDLPGQVWLRTGSQFLNPNSGLCLAVPSTKVGHQLELAQCSADKQNSWTVMAPDSGNPDCTKESKGAKVACFAAAEWNHWHQPTSDHTALLTTYTDGASYEEWCADFVSYVYKEAGYPFTGGEANGWDESNANLIQYMGFTKHNAGSYIPHAGDVAYFDYNGGHTEIVVSGGSKPTFIYGDSATVDPSTGNGQMEANTMTSDGFQGRVIYYLSPDF